ncbi:putative membrane protein YphA (DoxX/SURF4 family) [Lutibacter oceani]|uniref:Putative membrane protein YphA (DoxX/SURF4 family) n=1 Tax=Lutibacter oceani TaxID=1853311 RepID=A0A3D9RV27_9FLAO|nr:BT_3928 family protein [Lutibacter oceani]REE80525.1 putative membrane protein YphA (DoxX/SURF4 family) [Lutibacter oceani]
MKLLVYLSRFIVAVTFIFSGFVKLVDPLGSAYKFQEYFSADVLNMEFLIPYALPFSIILILAEIVLGVMLLVGYLPKLTVWSLLGIILVFLFLTWYSAYYNKVTDCGCFGDAVKLSSWGTFYKNIVLVVFILILVKGSKHIKPLFSMAFAKWTTFLSFFLFLYIIYYVLIHLPIIDFRPYAVGKNIPEGMEYRGDEEPPIHDFFLETEDGEDLTNTVLEQDKVMLVISYNISISDKKGFNNIKEVTDEAIKSGYTVYALSSSMNEEFTEIKNEYNLNFDMLFGDETMLKTVIRSNPGIVILQKGTVIGKYSWVDVDNINF